MDINPCVDVPEKIVQKLQRAAKKEKGPIPVKGRLNGKPFKTTVVKYRGAWRLYLNTYMRADAGIDVGDRATVELEFDPEPRTVPMPPALARALEENPQAKAFWEKFRPGDKRGILLYLNSLKRPESLERNIAKIIADLLKKKRFTKG